MAQNFSLSGNIIDIPAQRIYPGTIQVTDGKISSIQEEQATYNTYLLPGFVDAHVHVESSMLTPSEFARLAVVHGTIATVSDPHEIANVLGVEGVQYMLDNGRTPYLSNSALAPPAVYLLLPLKQQVQR